MSLVDGVESGCASAIEQLVADLEAGTSEDRAVLLNLKEEDRIPESRRAAFHRKISGIASMKRAADRVYEACSVAYLTLAVAVPRPAVIRGPWRTYLSLSTLQKYGYVSKVTRPGSAPPRRLPLRRPIGRTEAGDDRVFWITPAAGTDADELRDRLGLGRIADREELYNVEVAVDAEPDRPFHIPTALDSNAAPEWRRPGPRHSSPWGMTRDLRTDDEAEPELLARPHTSDPLEANHVGPVRNAPPTDYLGKRLL